MNFLKFTLLLVGLVFAQSCKVKTNNSEEKTIWINSSKQECTGVGPMDCMLVQFGEKKDEDKWQLFYDEIEGFTYEPGYVYKLKVKKTMLDPQDVAADASSMHYSLVKILEKQEDKRLAIHDIWALTRLFDKVYTPMESARHPSLEINTTEMRFHGNDGCNSIFGEIKKLTTNELEFGAIAGTKMACPDMNLDVQFHSALQKTTNYTVVNMTLTFYDASKNELIAFKKVD